MGHDHVNNWAMEWEGITLSYGVTSTDRIYADSKRMGCQSITIHDDNTFTIDQYFDTYEGGK